MLWLNFDTVPPVFRDIFSLESVRCETRKTLTASETDFQSKYVISSSFFLVYVQEIRSNQPETYKVVYGM